MSTVSSLSSLAAKKTFINNKTAFPTFVDLQNNKNLLPEGAFIITGGYYEMGDGGGSEYQVFNETQDNAWSTQIATGQWVSICKADLVSYRMFGAKLDGVTDDSNAVTSAHAYADSKGVRIENHEGVLTIGSVHDLPVSADMDLTGTEIRYAGTAGSCLFAIRGSLNDATEVAVAHKDSFAKGSKPVCEGLSKFAEIQESCVALGESGAISRSLVFPVDASGNIAERMKDYSLEKAFAKTLSYASTSRESSLLASTVNPDLPFREIAVRGVNISHSSSAFTAIKCQHISGVTLADITLDKNAKIEISSCYNLVMRNVRKYETSVSSNDVYIKESNKIFVESSNLAGMLFVDGCIDTSIERSRIETLAIGAGYGSFAIKGCELDMLRSQTGCWGYFSYIGEIRLEDSTVNDSTWLLDMEFDSSVVTAEPIQYPDLYIKNTAMPNATTMSFLLSMPMKSTLRTGGVKPEFSSGIGNTGSYIIKQVADSTEATDTWEAGKTFDEGISVFSTEDGKKYEIVDSSQVKPPARIVLENLVIPAEQVDLFNSNLKKISGNTKIFINNCRNVNVNHNGAIIGATAVVDGLELDENGNSTL